MQHDLQRRAASGCGTRSGLGPHHSALVGLSGSVYHRSHRKVRGLLDQLLGVEISTGVIKTIRSGWHGMVLGPSAAIGAISRRLQLLAIGTGDVPPPRQRVAGIGS